MARLIDADALYNGTMKDEYFRFKETDKTGREAFAYSCAMERLAEAPAVDAAPVVHGRWIEVGDFIWKCSVCGAEDCYAYTWGEVKRQDDLYCPKCGAKMDGGENGAGQ